MKSCIEFGKDNDYVWKEHSTLREEREFHSVVVLPEGAYILGGKLNRYTSEFLPTGGTLWQEGPDILSPGLSHACAVAIDSTRFVLIGGKVFNPKDSVTNVRVYDSVSSTWEQIWKNDTASCLLHKTMCQLLGTIELHCCVCKTLRHHRGPKNFFQFL